LSAAFRNVDCAAQEDLTHRYEALCAHSPPMTSCQRLLRSGGDAMGGSVSADAARLELMLTELRLPTIKAMWAALTAQSDKEGWPAARLAPGASLSLS
jgi:hypothetical protein